MRIFIAVILSLGFSVVSADAQKTVIYVLFDGLAPAMINAADTPNLDKIRSEGSWTHNMKPVFPTVSAVNHTSYVTGCLPRDHGIVSNYFYAKAKENPTGDSRDYYDGSRDYYDGSRDADWRLGCQAIWEVAEQAGHASAALGFPGHYSSRTGATATFAPRELTWKESPEDPARTDQIIELLKMPASDRPAVIAAYYKGPDWIGHWSGTTAPETLAATSAADAEVGRLMDAITALDPEQQVSLFVAADHSMVDVETYFNIGRVFYKHDIEGKFASDGAHAFIYLDDPTSANQVVSALKTYEMLSVFRWPHYPDYFPIHTSNHEGRSGDLLIVLDQPYWIADPSEFPEWASWLGLTRFWPETLSLSAGIKAGHGYPPHTANMGTAFYAWGGGIAKATEIRDFRIIDAAPSALDWLGLPAGDKTAGVVQPTLFKKPDRGFSAPIQNVASQ